MYDIELIKKRISCVEYAQRCGFPIHQSGDRCISPLRQGAENPTSFVVYDDFYYDFSAGQGGDVIELCAAFAHSGDRGAAIRDLAAITGVVSDNTANTEAWLDYTNRMNAMTAFYHASLSDDDYAYLHGRGLTDEDIDRLMIGRVADGPLKGRLFLPYFSGLDGYVCYYATRALPGGAYPESKYRKQKRDEFCQHLPWGLQTLNRPGDTLIIAEGYFDAVSYEAQGYPVLSAITGRFSREQLPVVLAVSRKFKQVMIVYDNDFLTHAGDGFTRTMADILTKNHIPFVVGTVPQPYHDVSEYYAAHGDIATIVSNAQPGVAYLASRFIEFPALESYILTVARHTKRSELESVFDHLKKVTEFDPRRLDALLKTATTAPPETIIADEILHDHQLVFIPAVGFYEYANGVWTRKFDDQIQRYADTAYGTFSTAQRIKAIPTLLRTRALRTDITFDARPVWNFINGTLELDTGRFRDAEANDFCSLQSKYPYNPEATHDHWSQFIDDVSAGDPRAAELLQLIPGYVFEPTNRFEKIFVLSGSGGNGKSKYLEILRQLFGESCVSHLSPRAMLDKFQLISFRESIVNIAGEIRSDLRDVEEKMKSVASGEPQSACYKSKDFTTFIPRTKLIFATNAQLTSNDTSEGLARRLIIVEFKVSFVDHPDPNDPYQRQKNIDILDELEKELQSGGIFNWAYEGYKLLQSVGYFTETADQAELLAEFRRSSNPVLVFWEDYGPNMADSISNQALYHDYLQWCVDNGERAMPSRAFHREFKAVSGRDYASYRTAKERGYRKVTTTMSSDG